MYLRSNALSLPERELFVGLAFTCVPDMIPVFASIRYYRRPGKGVTDTGPLEVGVGHHIREERASKWFSRVARSQRYSSPG